MSERRYRASGGQACRKAGSAEGAAIRPLPSRPRRGKGSLPYHKANGILTMLKLINHELNIHGLIIKTHKQTEYSLSEIKNNNPVHYPQTWDKNPPVFSGLPTR